MVRIGHRGAAGWEPQNTRLSFEKAVSLGCHFIETDVHLCRTGELVLCHDARIDAASNGSGRLDELSLGELRKFDFGKGQQIMELGELLDLAEGRTGLNIELKSPGSGHAAAVQLARALAASSWRAADIRVTSFNHPELRTFHRELPEVPAGALIKSILLDTAAYLDLLEASFLVTSLEFIQKELVDLAHAAGREIYVYTVDDPRDIARMQQFGVDGLISNYPDRVPV